MKCLTLVGAGSMGGALLSRWLSPQALESKEGSPWIFQVVHPRPLTEQVIWKSDFLDLPHDPEILVFAVKPQVLEKVLLSYREWIPPHCLVVSVAAGKTLSFFSSLLHPETPVLRAMPNLAVSCGKGVVGFCKNPFVTQTHLALFHEAFQTLGHLYPLEEEEMGLFTVLGGSGPAFLYFFMEALEKAGENLGFKRESTASLIRHMAEGALALLSETSFSLEKLRAHITSPQGVTAAGVDFFLQQGVEKIIQGAVEAALKRNQDLGGK